jgi:hypothetical protein
MEATIDQNKVEARHPIDEILADIGIYQNPAILLEQYQKPIAEQQANQDELGKYYALLSNIRYAWQKSTKYEQYFEHFYPVGEKIGNIEALNHHIHSYLEDMDIFKEKIDVFLGSLKNDIKKVVTDKKAIEEFFKAGTDKNFEVFEGISQHRNPHHHGGMRFIDGDLLKAENAQNERNMFQKPPLLAMLKTERVEEFFAQLKKKENESFELAKARWIKTAKNNTIQNTPYLAELMNIIKPNLYQFLNIRPIQEFCGIPNK